jgi:hypothetical protein
MTMPAKELLVAAGSIKNMLVARAVGDQSGNDREYHDLRQQLIERPSVKVKLPECVLTCRTLSEFWGYMKPKFDSYQERREYLKHEFDPLLTMLEAGATSPGDDTATEILAKLDWNEVQAAWRRALERKASDPEGAITAARTLLESVCKHVLDEAEVPYDPKADLPPLYSLTAKTLKMSPSQHTEEIFKQILGGCHSVVQGLGALRSKVGDAHGQGKKAVKPAARHAELAVNLAGAMATFIAQTWEKVKEEGVSSSSA